MSRKQQRLAVVGIAAVAAVGVAGYVYWHNHRAKSNPAPAATATTNTSTPTPSPAPAGGPDAGPSHDGTQSATASSTLPTRPVTSTSLAVPTGQLLNKHSISLSSTDPTTSPAENSTCQSVPGASCDIQLSKAGVTKSVGAQSVDVHGGANFYWNAQSLGLTPGTWTVVAVATQGSQTASSSADTLTVNP